MFLFVSNIPIVPLLLSLTCKKEEAHVAYGLLLEFVRKVDRNSINFSNKTLTLRIRGSNTKGCILSTEQKNTSAPPDGKSGAGR
jgi:hypothetical protein